MSEKNSTTNESSTKKRRPQAQQRKKSPTAIQRKASTHADERDSLRHLGQSPGDALPRQGFLPRLGVNTTHILSPTATLARPGVIVQPAMSVNAADDHYEVEANRVADAVMRMPTGPISDGWGKKAPTPAKRHLTPAFQQKEHSGAPEVSHAPLPRLNLAFQEENDSGAPEVSHRPLPRLQLAFQEENDSGAPSVSHTPLPRLQLAFQAENHSGAPSVSHTPLPRLNYTFGRQNDSVARSADNAPPQVTPEIENRIGQMDGGGQPLPEETRGFFEQRMGADFSQVRVHTDGNAAETSQAIQARAFTSGNNIAFNSGEYNPGTSEGKHLLAHELTHTVQQGAAGQLKRQMIQRKVEAEAEANEFPMAGPAEVAPQSPESDPTFQEVVSQSQEVKAQEKEHSPTEKKVSEAKEAAVQPPEEKLGSAQDEQAGEIATEADQSAAAAGQAFDKDAFKAAIKGKIDGLMPQSEEEFEKIGSSGKLDGVKEAVNSEVDQGKEQAQGKVDEKTDEAPDIGSVPEKEVTPLSPAEAGAAPTSVEGEKAAPKAKGRSEFEEPLAEKSQGLDKQLADAEVTEEQLENSNEPEFLSALDSKREAQSHTLTNVTGYREQEEGLISGAQASSATAATEQVTALHDDRTTLFGEVDSLQVGTKDSDEGKRKEIGSQINQIYDLTTNQVTKTLDELDATVDQLFTTGAEAAKQTFITNATSRAAAYKAERYNEEDDSVWGSVTGGATELWDSAVGMPDEYVQIFEDERDNYIETMDSVLDQIANAVATTLKTARQHIQSGRQQIADYVSSLPEELQQIGQECAGEVQGKFDALEQQIDDKQQQLVDDLAQRYSDSLAEVDAAVEQARQESEGMLTGASRALVGPIASIIEMKNMLLGVLDRAAGAITDILADPVGFIGNLLDAVGQGFNQFVANIGTHLQTGLISWLTGTIAEAGITLPESFDLQGIFQLVMQVAGISFDQIMGKIGNQLGIDVGAFMDPVMQVIDIYQSDGLSGLMSFGLEQIIGEEGVAALMEVVEIVQAVMSGDFGALWELVKEQLSNLKEMVMGQIMQFVSVEVIEQGVIWVLSLFNPAGAFIKACKMIYDVVMFFVNNGQKIMNLVNAVIDSITAIASGDIGSAAAAIEQALASSIPVAIGFLSSLLSLGDIPAKVQEIIKGVRDMVNSAIDSILNLPPVQMVMGFIKTLIEKVKNLAAKGIDKAKGALGMDGKDKSDASDSQVKDNADENDELEQIDSEKVKQAFVQAADNVGWGEEEETIQRMPLKVKFGGTVKIHTLQEAEQLFVDVAKELGVPKKVKKPGKKKKRDNPDYADLRYTILRFHQEDRVFNSMADLQAEAEAALRIKQEVNDIDWDDPDVSEKHPEKDEFFNLFATLKSPVSPDQAWNLTIGGIVERRNQLAANQDKNTPNPAYDKLAALIANDLKGIEPLALWSGGIETSLYARGLGYTTLESTSAGRIYDALKLFKDFSTLGQLWNNLSRQFVQTMTGEVHVFMRTYDPKSVLFDQELPELSPKVGAEVSSIKWHVLISPRNAPTDLKEVGSDGSATSSYAFNSYEEAVQVMQTSQIRNKDRRKVKDPEAASIKEQLREQLLAQLPFVGPSKIDLLLTHFSAINPDNPFHAIRNASLDDFQNIDGIGQKTAQKVFESF